MDQEQVISWQTPEYQHQKKSPDWFWALGIIAVAGVTTSLLLENILLGILIAIGACTIALFAIRRPELVTIILSPKGILVGHRLYPYSSVVSFFVEPEEHALLLETTNPFSKQLRITISETISSDDVRLFLNAHLEEKEQEYDSLPDQIANFFGF